MKLVHDFNGTEVLDASSRSIVLVDATLPDNPITYVNAAFSALCGYSESEVIGRNCRFLQGPDTDPLVIAEMRAAIAAGTGIRCEVLNYRKDGTIFWNDLTIDPIHDATGHLAGFIGIQHNSDAMHLAHDQRDQAEARLASIADHVPGYIYRRVMRADGHIEVDYCSSSLARLLGIDDADVARSFYDLVHPNDREPLLAAIRRSAADMAIFREEFRLVSPEGATHWLRSEAPPRRLADGSIIWDGIAVVISAEKRWESEITSQALRDPLTGLLSRAAWSQALSMALAVKGGASTGCGILHIDIDGFGDLNRRLGQLRADEILRQTAARLSRIADSVAGVAARLAGDEFALLVPTCDRDSLYGLAQSTGSALALPVATGGQHIRIATSIGGALSSVHDGADGAKQDAPSEVMTQAELALRWAKQAGGNRQIIYSPDEDDRFCNQTLLARSLERAIAEDELELHYQPIVDLASGRIVSAEALVRWNHPTLGLQRPDLFIPLAERSGLIVELGRWVLERAIRQHQSWKAAGLAPPMISINVSGHQLIAPGFVAFADGLLRSLDANAADFEIELTESLLIEPSRPILASFRALRSMGFSIAIDDFGSGHASFRYLRDFPVDKIKLDQVFVRKLVLHSADALIIRAVISMARSLGLQLVAEGIETQLQRDFLQSEGCRIGQGYFFSLPLIAEDFAWLLAGKVPLPIRAPPDAPQTDDQQLGPDPMANIR